MGQDQKVQILIRGMWQDDVTLALANGQLNPALARLSGFTGDVGSQVSQASGQGAEIIVGLGYRAQACTRHHRLAAMVAGRTIVQELSQGQSASTAVNLDVDLDSFLPKQMESTLRADLFAALTDGLLTGSYRFRMTSNLDAESDVVDSAGLCEVGRSISSAVNQARNFVNLPPFALTPQRFAEQLQTSLSAQGVRVRIREHPELREEGFGGLLAVGQGSVNPPVLVELAVGDPDPDLVFVGKGITFDTGGLSMKTPDMLQTMKIDMAGAAAIAGLFSVLPEIAPGKNIAAVLAIAENMPGDQAVRPGDVITLRGGKLLEILDTDFEGRVVLADALTRASELEPATIVDLATLTYAAIHALGEDTAAMVTNHDGLAQALSVASHNSGEDIWRMPLLDAQRQQIVSSIADYKNHPGVTSGRTSSAALLLQEFVSPGIAWAHIDMTGPAWLSQASRAQSEGATGFGVRLLAEFLHSYLP